MESGIPDVDECSTQRCCVERKSNHTELWVISYGVSCYLHQTTADQLSKGGPFNYSKILTNQTFYRRSEYARPAGFPCAGPGAIAKARPCAVNYCNTRSLQTSRLHGSDRPSKPVEGRKLLARDAAGSVGNRASCDATNADKSD
uniref:Uncharacterized protein n=1 Tax=Knipowitschia caucasica TaxID=637954 RepID=A0AAV2JU98_KNICA